GFLAFFSFEEQIMFGLRQLTLRSFSILAFGASAGFSTQAMALAIDAFPSNVSFFQVAVGQSQTQTVYLRNNTREDMNFVRFSEWGDRLHFRLDDWNCRSIRAFGSCTIRI